MTEYALIHKNRYKFVLKTIKDLNLPKGARILDVGCYPMDMFNALSDLGYDMFGISSEHEKVKHKNVTALNIETDELPFKENFFDLILFSEVMEHMIYDPQVYLAKFKKVLKPGGFLLITTPNAVHIKHRLELLIGKNQNFPMFQFEGSIYHRHNREFVLSEVKTELERAGFNIFLAEEFSAYSPFRQKLQSEPLGVKLGKAIVFLPTYIFPRLRDSLLVVTQKHG